MLPRIIVCLNLLTVSVLCLSAARTEAEQSGWSFDPNVQYHVQTDEGSERYFRFQTLNGQYRKEKRLPDGTVIGTEGWLDPLGYLRLKDYIADDKGYRILRSKILYVGQSKPIYDAVSETKKRPAQAGVLLKPARPPNPFRRAPSRVAPAAAAAAAFGNDVNPDYHVHRQTVGKPRPEFPRNDETYNVANGFQYYLKRQYHEEQNEEGEHGSDTSAGTIGSFGYIDPFGIRRVVYYKVDPRSGQFLHEKNNRYVGFAATPYDPTLPNTYRRELRSAN